MRRHGFLGTKVTDIAAAAGVSHGLVHHYFGSKAEVFVAIIERTMAGADALPNLLLSMQGTYRERLAWFAQMILEGVKAMPEVFFLSIEAGANAAVPAEARRLVAEKGALSVQALGRFIAAGQAAGEFKRGDANTLAIHLFALYRKLGWKDGDYPLAEYAGRNILTIPLFPAMTRADVARVVTALTAILRAHQKS